MKAQESSAGAECLEAEAWGSGPEHGVTAS